MSGGYDPTTIDAARTALLAWCRDVTGREIVLQYDSEMPKPTSPFVEIFVEATALPNGRVLTLAEDGLSETISTLTLITTTLNFLGGDAMDSAGNLRNSLYATERYLDIYKILGYGEVVSLQDLSFLETGHFKQRAELRVTFYARLENTYISSYYDTVETTVNRE